ncbi:MAG: galactokinase [Bacteroidetes bacterium]|nr:galactokinase [Bacteroidota bacterium]
MDRITARLAELEALGAPPSPHALFVPGRIEVLGKHTDYAGGESLTCASTHGFVAFVHPWDAPVLRLEDLARGQTAELDFSDPRPQASWQVYPAAVLRRVVRHFGAPKHGVRIVMASDLPSASGMSSSSALVVTVLLALLGEHEGPLPFENRADLAGFGGAVESGADWRDLPGDAGVGTKGGSQDHTAILCGAEGHLSLFGYHPITCHERVAWPQDQVFVVAGSGVKARKTGEALERYNRVSWRAAEVARLFGADIDRHFRHLGGMMGEPDFDRESLRWAITDDDLWDRFQQFERETSHVLPEALRAINEGDWARFGAATAESQQMAADWLGNQVPETESLVRLAIENGAHAASSFGAGFGGAVWAVVPRAQKESFTAAWQAAFHTAFPAQEGRSVFLNDEPGAPAWTSSAGVLGGRISS